MGKFQTKEKSNGIYWEEVIELYRASKTVRKLLKKIPLSQLSEITGFSKNYICGVREFSIKPNREFIEKINEIKK